MKTNPSQARSTSEFTSLTAKELQLISQQLNLSPLQATAAGLVLAGRTNKQIAKDMGKSPSAIKRYLEATYLKANVDSRGALAARIFSILRSHTEHDGKA